MFLSTITIFNHHLLDNKFPWTDVSLRILKLFVRKSFVFQFEYRNSVLSNDCIIEKYNSTRRKKKKREVYSNDIFKFISIKLYTTSPIRNCNACRCVTRSRKLPPLIERIKQRERRLGREKRNCEEEERENVAKWREEIRDRKGGAIGRDWAGPWQRGWRGAVSCGFFILARAPRAPG